MNIYNKIVIKNDLHVCLSYHEIGVYACVGAARYSVAPPWLVSVTQCSVGCGSERGDVLVLSIVILFSSCTGYYLAALSVSLRTKKTYV